MSDSKQRVHIVGAPRSGTTLLLELMTTGFRFSHCGKEEVSLLNTPKVLPSNGMLCTKNPQDWALMRYILPVDPDQYFITTVRDPRDVVVSKHGLRPDV